MKIDIANKGISVLIVSIIRLKLTVDLVNTKDISWEGVSSIVWW